MNHIYRLYFLALELLEDVRVGSAWDWKLELQLARFQAEKYVRRVEITSFIVGVILGTLFGVFLAPVLFG